MYSKNDLKVNVDKNDLVTILQVNRAKHASDYETAKKGFRKLLVEELEGKLRAAKAGEKVELRFENQSPKSYIEEYDDVIEMLQMATNNEIELTHVQYKQWVKDEWDWKEHWSLSNIAYLSAAPDEEQ